MDKPTLGWRVVDTYQVPGPVLMYCATAAYWSPDRVPPPSLPLPDYTWQGYGNTPELAKASCRLVCRDDLNWPLQADPNPSAPATATTAQEPRPMTPADIRARLPAIAQQLAQMIAGDGMPAGLEVGGEHVASITATVALHPRDGQGESVFFTLSVGTGERPEGEEEPPAELRQGPHEAPGLGDVPFN